MWRSILVLVVAGLVLPVENAQAGAATGSISGAIFRDLNGDGVRAGGEPGLAGRSVILSRDGSPIDSANSAADGSYRFDSLEDGPYTIQAIVDQYRGLCADYAFSFNPYAQQSYCINYTVPWRTSRAASVDLTVQSGANAEENFGAYEADAAVIAGIALLEDRRAPEGTLIEAMFNGQECGSTTTKGETSELSYLLVVLGAGERAGCAAAGDTIRFRIGGVAAAEVRFYEPFEQTDGRLYIQPLSAIRQHSWLWAERRTPEAPPLGTVVEALVDGTVCGSVEVAYVGGEAGFSRLLVASDELVAGCGNHEAVISFRTTPLDGAATLRWEADVREMSPRFYGDVDCNYGASALDALLLLQLVSGLRTGLPCPEGSDVSGSGATDAVDATLVLQFSAGLLERLPVSSQ